MSSTQQSLQNEYVLEHIFGFLSLEEMKKCRFVDRIWRNVGNRILRQKSLVRFHLFNDKKNIFKGGHLKLVKILEIYDSYVTYYGHSNNIPFASFNFRGDFDLAMLDILKMGRSVKELNIETCSTIKSLSVERFNLNVLFGGHLKKLHCSVFSNTTIFYLSIDQIPSVQDLRLNYCEIVIGDAVQQLCPKKIDLGSKIKFSKRGEILETFVINELFDLRETRVVKITGKRILDLSLCTNNKIWKDEVFLEDVTVVNWDKCNWKVRELRLTEVPFLEKNLMEIISFNISKATVDFSVVYNPINVKEVFCFEGTIVLDARFYFPNVTKLWLVDQSVSALRNFSESENLKDVRLIGEFEYYEYKDNAVVRIEDFPRHIKTLYLESIPIKGTGVCHVETLEMTGYFHYDSFDLSNQILKYFEGECLFFIFLFLNNNTDAIPFLKTPKSFKYFWLGDFKWDNIGEFEQSEFPNYVDKMSACYIFKREKGLAICDDPLGVDPNVVYNTDKYFDLIRRLEAEENS